MSEATIDIDDAAELDAVEAVEAVEELPLEEEAGVPVKKEPPPPPEECPPCKAGSPAWMATFADMATLLMAFFVLILSFAHVNVPKYKEVAGAMKTKFGVQTIAAIIEAPTARNIVAMNYKSARTEPTAMDTIEEQKTDEEPKDVELRNDVGAGQSTTNATLEEVKEELAQEIADGFVSVAIENGAVTVRTNDSLAPGAPGQLDQEIIQVLSKVASVQTKVDGLVKVVGTAFQSSDADSNGASRAGGRSAEQIRLDGIDDQYRQIRANLSTEISQGLAEVERDGDLIIIRLAERGSFASGLALLQPSFERLLDNVGASLVGTTGLIQIEGHTDNVPLAFGSRYRDNWDLSSARSASVADYLLGEEYVPPGNMVVMGLADTQPIASNDSALGRASNRRIEIVVKGD
ncbi:OmpA family protein [Gammaproteobacteria bacterium]|nr:OmpA family protein [Gammaproteobacteria bacterium]MDB4004100.1 OmpA family protein [Gammaproteobacteria bacterium]MDB4136977.1 OmpA family protein [Gammaproteobacteria bacterium]MDC1391179.1 OmpA family protein [Gammaproteobacteria bacterium]